MPIKIKMMLSTVRRTEFGANARRMKTTTKLKSYADMKSTRQIDDKTNNKSALDIF